MAEERRLRYKLTFDVEDYGVRSFSSEIEAEDHDHMALVLADDIALAFGIMNQPPFVYDLVQRFHSGGLWCDLGMVFDYWDAEHDQEECVEITVNVDALAGTRDEAEIKKLLAHCELAGFKVKRSGRTGDVASTPRMG